MTIFGLNSPEIFLLLVITLIILGTKRIEKGLSLLSRLLRFLLSNQSSFNEIAKKIEPIKDKEEAKEKDKEIIKTAKSVQAKKIEPVKDKKEAKEEEIGSEKRSLKKSNSVNKVRKLAKTKDPKGKVVNKNVKRSEQMKADEDLEKQVKTSSIKNKRSNKSKIVSDVKIDN